MNHTLMGVDLAKALLNVAVSLHPGRESERKQEELFAVAFRRTHYESVPQLHQDLDAHMDFYNRECAQQGYRATGRTKCTSAPSRTARATPRNPKANDATKG